MPQLTFSKMGCGSSVEAVERVSVLEGQLMKAVLDAKTNRASFREAAGKHQTFNALLLRFPKMRPGDMQRQFSCNLSSVLRHAH